MKPQISNNLKLPDDQFFSIGDVKTGICLHHTCGGTAASTVEWWKKDGKMVGTAFIVDRDGKIYQVFEPKGWAYQFGLTWNSVEKIKFEKRFIGIEIASEGGLIESNGDLYCFNTISARTKKNRNETLDYGKVYRDYRYFDKYEPVQIDAVVQLVNYLCSEFNIERKIPSEYMDYYGEKLKDFNGIIGHVNVREDKSDPAPDDSFWQKIITGCNLQKINIDVPAAAESQLTSDVIEKLFSENAIHFGKMNRAACSMVKGLLWELQDMGRNTYIRLSNAVENGHTVDYAMVQGDNSLVELAAHSLGFKSWKNNRLEVYNA